MRALRGLAVAALLALAGCAGGPDAAGPGPAGAGATEVGVMIETIARRHGVPDDLVHAVVARESGYRPAPATGPTTD